VIADQSKIKEIDRAFALQGNYPVIIVSDPGCWHAACKWVSTVWTSGSRSSNYDYLELLRQV